jgi:UDP-glucose 4-epimerase
LCALILKLTDSKLTVTFKPYSKEDARQLVQNRIGSPQKASEKLGFMYKDSLENGLNNLIEWRTAQREKSL